MENSPSPERQEQNFPEGERPKTSESSAPPPGSHNSSPRVPRQNGIPPKRPSTVAQRLPESNTHHGAVVSTPVSSPAKTPLQKRLSARSLAPASTRRPTSTLTPTAKATKATRPMTHFSEAKNVQRAGNDTLDGTKRSDISGSAQRISVPASTLPDGEAKRPRPVPGREYLSAAGTIPETKSAVSRTNSASPTKGRQQTSVPTAGTISRPATSRLRTSSPMKTTTKSNTRLSRPTTSIAAAGTDRSRLSGASSMDGTPGADSKKRTSTMKVSAAHSSPDKHSTSAAVVKPTKAIRPGLGTRKSTMSVSIGQRLHEMELVHQMLNAAMDENSSDTDETKEGYVKKADEQLAYLKAKLEDVQLDEHNAEPALKRDDIESSVEKTFLDKGPLECKGELDPISIMHMTDINAAGGHPTAEPQQYDIAPDNDAGRVQTAMKTDPGEYTTMTETLKATFAKDIETLRLQLNNAEHTAKSLAQDNAKHTLEREARIQAKVDELEGAAKVIDGLQNSIKELQMEISETKAINTTMKDHIHALEEQAIADSGAFQARIRAKIEELGESAKVVEYLQKYTIELQETASTASRSNKELSELVKMRDIEIAELTAVYESSRATIRDLEVSVAATASIYREESRLKDQKSEDLALENKDLRGRIRFTEAAMDGANEEIHHLNEVVDDLQKMISRVHVTTNRNLDDMRAKLTQDHEDDVDRLRLDNLSAQATITEELINVEKEHEEALSALRSKHCEEIENKDIIIQHNVIELARADLKARETVKNMSEEAQAAARAHALEKANLLDQLSTREGALVKETDSKRRPSISVPTQSDSGNSSTGMSIDESLNSGIRITGEILEHQPTQEAYERLQSDYRSVLDELAKIRVELANTQALTPPASDFEDKHTRIVDAQLPSEAEASILIIPSTQEAYSGVDTHLKSLDEADCAKTVSDQAEDLEFLDELCILEHLGAAKHREFTDVTKRLQALRDEIARAEELVMRSVPEDWLQSCTEADARKLIADALGEDECPRLRNEIRKLKAQLYNIIADESLDPQAKARQGSASSFDSALTGGWGYQALQAAAGAQQEENARLVEELRAAKESNDVLKHKLEENELALKSTPCVLVDRHTCCHGTPQNGQSSVSLGLDWPRGGFAIMSDTEDEKEEHEELGPRIVGRVAGLRERIGQIKAEIDEDVVRTENMYSKLGPTPVASPARSQDVSDQENFLPRYPS